MKINFSYGSFIKVEGYPNDSTIEVPEKCTVRELLGLMKLPPYIQKAVIIHINNEPVWLSTVIKENDTVKLYRQVGGG